MRMTYIQKIEAARKKNIYLPDDLLEDTKKVGVYGFFAVKGKEEYCFYIGKTTVLPFRLLGASEGHVYMYLNADYSKLVPANIDKHLKEGYIISVRILDVVDYTDTIFSKAAHRLAYAEIKRIIEYQEKGQCIIQRPEGVGKNEEDYWEKHYKCE